MGIGDRTIERRIVAAVLIGFLLGTLWLIAMRFITWQSPNVHYHANFALYVNSQKENFDSFTFYEEVQSCSGDEVNNPKTRVHMHDRINHVVHVHDAGATWGAFFANIDYVLGNTVLKTDDGEFVTSLDGKQLTFMLNNEIVDDVANLTIRSEDILLINYGNEDQATLSQRFTDITKDAGEYNRRNDPSSCTGTKPVTFGERLKQAIGIGNNSH